MSNVDNYNFDERDKNLIKAVLDGTKKLIKSATDPIITALKDHGIYVETVFKANSPKQITERGHELLNAHNVDSYLKENCLLLKDEKLKEKTEPQIFIECLSWVKTKGKEKVAEIRLNSNISEEQCIELLALDIMYKINPIESTSDK